MKPILAVMRRVALTARPALLLGLAAGLALLVASQIHAEIGGLWVILTAIVVVQSSAPDSWQTAVDRITGTLVGVVVGGAVGLMFRSTPPGVILAVLVSALVCCFIPPLKRTAHIASLTALIVILLPQGSSAVTAWHRFIDTLIGIAVALVVSAVALLLDHWFGYVEDPATKKF